MVLLFHCKKDFLPKEKKIKLTVSWGSEQGGELLFWLSLTMLSIICLFISELHIFGHTCQTLPG